MREQAKIEAIAAVAEPADECDAQGAPLQFQVLAAASVSTTAGRKSRRFREWQSVREFA